MENRIISICEKTGKTVLKEYSDDKLEWLCLHRDTRAEELEEIETFLGAYK